MHSSNGSPSTLLIQHHNHAIAAYVQGEYAEGQMPMSTKASTKALNSSTSEWKNNQSTKMKNQLKVKIVGTPLDFKDDFYSES